MDSHTECRLRWKSPCLSPPIQVDSEFKVKMKCCTAIDPWNKWDHMGLDGHLKASTVAGLIDKYKGASKYLNNRLNPGQVTLTLVCRIVARKECLDWLKLPNELTISDGQEEKMPDASHVVVGVVYGAEIYCAIADDFYGDEVARSEAEKNLSKLSSKMMNGLMELQNLTEFKLKLCSDEIILAERLQCRLYADLQSIAVRECNLFYAYTHCFQLIEKIKGTRSKAIPISVNLCPLNSIFPTTVGFEKAFEYREVDKVLANRCCKIGAKLEKIIVMADTNRSHFTKFCRVSHRQFTETVETFQNLWKKKLNKVVVDARQSKIGDDDEVERVIKIVETHPLFKPSRLARWLKYKKDEAEMAAKLASINGVTFFASKSKLREKLCESFDEEKFSLVLTIPPLDERTNKLFKVMKNCVESEDELVAVDREDDEEEGDDKLPWHKVPSKRKKVREMVNHVKRNEHLKNRVQFFITVGENNQEFQLYSVYKSEDLIKDGIDRLPVPPTNVRFCLVANSIPSILVEWDYEDLGYPCTFLVEYRLKADTDGDWNQLRTSKPGETWITIPMESGSIEFRVTADTFIGCSKCSDIIFKYKL